MKKSIFVIRRFTNRFDLVDVKFTVYYFLIIHYMRNHKCVKLFLTSIILLVATYCANAKHIIEYHNNDNYLELLSKETESEKSLANVKASYNPVAEQINVSFKLSKQGTVSIKLMDALGNEVLNLANSTLESGTHNLSFETSGKVAAGFYFVRVMSGIETVVKRVSIR